MKKDKPRHVKKTSKKANPPRQATATKSSMPKTSLIELLIQEAFIARENAHAPYSKFQVGASVLTADDNVYSGCNIENASYGGTVCAERVACWKAVSEGAASPFVAVCVVTKEKDIWPPCGLCRQVMAEFCTPDTLVIVANSMDNYDTFKFSELLPMAFTPEFLK